MNSPLIFRPAAAALTLAVLAGLLTAIGPAAAHDESQFESIHAPFTCGTEWVGKTRSHHGENDWNLDLNRSYDTWPGSYHDLGQPLLVQGDGVVTYVGWQVNAGVYVDIDYGDYGVRYIHLVDGSVTVEVGDSVTTGQIFGQLGATGNATSAHLHLEYWDSRGFEDARIWTLKQAGQPQTEVTFDGVVIEPGVPLVSTNCVNQPLPESVDETLAGHLDLLVDSGSAANHVVSELVHAQAPALDDTTESESYLDVTENGTNIIARIAGTDLAHETIVVSTSISSVFDCAPEGAEPHPCPGATEHAASTAVVLDLVHAMAEAETAPRRSVVFTFWDEYDDTASAAHDWFADPDNDIAAQAVAVIDYGVLGANATLNLRPLTLASRVAGTTTSWPGLTDVHATMAPPTLIGFEQHPLAGPVAHRLADHEAPVLAFHDLAGPCVGTPEDLTDVVDVAKLTLQAEAALAFVTGLAAADAVPTTDAAWVTDPLVDPSTLITLIDAAGFAGEPYVALDQLLHDEPAVLDEAHEAVIAAAYEQFALDLAAAPCSGHQSPAPFTDLRLGSYATNDVGLIYDLGVTTGTSPTEYSPLDNVTREQMGAFLARVWRLWHPDAAATEPMPFDDVDPSSFAFDDIALIYDLGITTGTSPTTYSPGDFVTREQMAAFLGRTWRTLHPDYDTSAVPEHPFGDVRDNSYAFDDIALIYDLGVTTGTSPTTYSPGDFVTREQMAAFLARLIRVATG